MKSLLLLTASGPLLVLTSHESLQDRKLLDELKAKGVDKFVAFEVPVTLAKERYGGHFRAVENNLHETDDLRVPGLNGQRISQLFRFDELGAPMLQEHTANGRECPRSTSDLFGTARPILDKGDRERSTSWPDCRRLASSHAPRLRKISIGMTNL